MAKSPSHGRDMGALYLLFWRRNYPHDRGTRPLLQGSHSPFVIPNYTTLLKQSQAEFDIRLTKVNSLQERRTLMQETLGKRIRKERLRYGMSQTELAKRVGISKTAMNQIEMGETADPRL